MHREASGQKTLIYYYCPREVGVRAAAGRGVMLATLPCSSLPPHPQKLCAVRSLVLEKPHAPPPRPQPAVPEAGSKFPRHVSRALYRQKAVTHATGKYI